MEREGRQQEPAGAVDEVEEAVDRVEGRERRHQVEGRGGQSPEMKQERLPAALAAQGVEPDQQVGDPGQREGDVGPVQAQPGQGVQCRDQLLAFVGFPEHLQVALRAPAQQALQLVSRERRFAVGQDDDVVGQQLRPIGGGGHAQLPGGRFDHEPDILERAHLAAHGEAAQADDQDRRKQERRGQAEPGGSGLDAHRWVARPVASSWVCLLCLRCGRKAVLGAIQLSVSTSCAGRIPRLSA